MKATEFTGRSRGRGGRDRPMALVGVSVLLLVACAGCTYFRNRGNDLLDVVWLDVGAGSGIAIDLQFTQMVQVGIGWYDVRKVGLGRRAFGRWRERGIGVLLGRRILYGERCELFSDTGGAPDGERGGIVFNPLVMRELLGREGPYRHVDGAVPTINFGAPWINLLDVDAGIVLIVGARIGLSPGEWLDFVLGWFGMDIGGDDEKAGPSEEEQQGLAALLMLAVREGDLGACVQLLRHFSRLADRTCPVSRVPNVAALRWRPLHVAAAWNRPVIARLLLGQGADPDARDGLGMTPLHVAAEQGSLGVALALLAAKADVNARDSDGRTPLALAVRAGRAEVARALRARGGKEK